MLAAGVSKMKESALSNITLILNILSENGTIFVRTDLFFKTKKNIFYGTTYLNIFTVIEKL